MAFLRAGGLDPLVVDCLIGQAAREEPMAEMLVVQAFDDLLLFLAHCVEAHNQESHASSVLAGRAVFSNDVDCVGLIASLRILGFSCVPCNVVFTQILKRILAGIGDDYVHRPASCLPPLKVMN